MTGDLLLKLTANTLLGSSRVNGLGAVGVSLFFGRATTWRVLASLERGGERWDMDVARMCLRPSQKEDGIHSIAPWSVKKPLLQTPHPPRLGSTE